VHGSGSRAAMDGKLRDVSVSELVLNERECVLKWVLIWLLQLPSRGVKE